MLRRDLSESFRRCGNLGGFIPRNRNRKRWHRKQPQSAPWFPGTHSIPIIPYVLHDWHSEERPTRLSNEIVNLLSHPKRPSQPDHRLAIFSLTNIDPLDSGVMFFKGAGNA